LFIKEAWLPGENQPLPISLWFGTRKVPKESEAILKLASMAMRHRDPAWTATLFLTLRKHAVFGEELGFAQVGTRKPAYYASTWAYVADLVLYRYQQLGILDEAGQPLAQRSLFAPADTTSETPATADPIVANNGITCPDCRQTGTIVTQGGCPTCSNCAWSRCS
jgi:ribonucleoside-diphosphate reductase alpha chain